MSSYIFSLLQKFLNLFSSKKTNELLLTSGKQLETDFVEEDDFYIYETKQFNELEPGYYVKIFLSKQTIENLSKNNLYARLPKEILEIGWFCGIVKKINDYKGLNTMEQIVEVVFVLSEGEILTVPILESDIEKIKVLFWENKEN